LHRNVLPDKSDLLLLVMLLSEIERQLEKLLLEKSKSGKTIAGENLGLSQAVYEFEHITRQLMAGNRRQPRYDASLFSENIRQSFGKAHPNQFHRPVDYQYPYLIWLFDHYQEGKALHQFVQEFFNSIKDHLNYPDILITSTGVTRCKTNLRLSMNALRDIGILMQQDSKGKRSFGLSAVGLLVVALLKFKIEDRMSAFTSNVTLQEPGEFTDRYLDERIIGAIHELRTEKGFRTLLSRIHEAVLDKKEEEILRNYSTEFAEALLGNLILKKSGVKEREKEKLVILRFVRNYESSKEFSVIKNKLQNHFTKKT
jgi:hypothetical protein